MTGPKVIEKRQAKQRIDALLVDRVDLVTTGDNPDARVVLWKSVASPEGLDKRGKCPECSEPMPPDQVCVVCGWTQAQPQDEPVSDAPEATSRATKSVTQSTVWAEIEKAAADLDAPTEEQRIDKLLMTEKGRLLRATYYRSGPVGRQSSDPSFLDKAHLEVVDAAKRKGENSHEYAEAMATRFDALGHTDQAEMWRAYAKALSGDGRK